MGVDYGQARMFLKTFLDAFKAAADLAPVLEAADRAEQEIAQRQLELQDLSKKVNVARQDVDRAIATEQARLEAFFSKSGQQEATATLKMAQRRQDLEQSLATMTEELTAQRARLTQVQEALRQVEREYKNQVKTLEENLQNEAKTILSRKMALEAELPPIQVRIDAKRHEYQDLLQRIRALGSA